MTRYLRLAFLGVAFLQIGLLMALVAPKERTLRTGTEVVLQTAPIDPRDLFRGEYVNLRYEISSLDSREVRFEDLFLPGDRVYVSLEKRGLIWSARAASSSRPDGLFIRGRVTGPFSTRDVLEVEYGIESFFIPEGSGERIERARDIKVRVTIDSSGNAVLTGLILDGSPFEP